VFASSSCADAPSAAVLLGDDEASAARSVSCVGPREASAHPFETSSMDESSSSLIIISGTPNSVLSLL